MDEFVQRFSQKIKSANKNFVKMYCYNFGLMYNNFVNIRLLL